MKFDVPFVGHSHIPVFPEWTRQLRAADWQRFVTTVDGLGYHAITTSEHYAMSVEDAPRLGAYWAHAFSVLAFVAGATTRVRLDTTVLVLPYHHPLELAKALSTIDVLSEGRLNVSIGIGHVEREFESLGVPFRERGARTDELLAALRELWTADLPSHHGRFYDVEGLLFEPKPVQQFPPIYVGGNSDAALRRAARHDGWQPMPRDIGPRDLPALLDRIRAEPAFAGKQQTFDVFWVGDVVPRSRTWAFAEMDETARGQAREQFVEASAELHECGVTRTHVPPVGTASLDEHLDFLAWFDAEVAPAVAAVTGS